MEQKFKLEYNASYDAYMLRAMSSSNGTNRVVDIYKTTNYIANGNNVDLWSPNEPYAQMWKIYAVSTNKILKL